MTGLRGWIVDRLHLEPIISILHKKSVPRHKHSFWYLFGGAAVFFFLVQVISGILLTLYYSPTPTAANESIHFLIDRVAFGWLIRSVHAWSAHMLVAVVLIHFFSTFFMRAYRKPREIMWMSGMVLLLLILGFAFTGYLLPWDATAYYATQIGTEIPRSIPVIGEVVVTMLRGGEYVAEESLKRLYAMHVVVLPLISMVVVLFHLLLNQAQGTSIPIGVRPVKSPIPFFPNYLYRDGICWISGTILLFWLCFVFPVQVGPKVDPLASAPAGIKPEWYFLALYETLRLLPPKILGLSSEATINTIIPILGIALFSMPFIDRKGQRGEKSMMPMTFGIIALTYMVVATILAYLI